MNPWRSREVRMRTSAWRWETHMFAGDRTLMSSTLPFNSSSQQRKNDVACLEVGKADLLVWPTADRESSEMLVIEYIYTTIMWTTLKEISLPTKNNVEIQ